MNTYLVQKDNRLMQVETTGSSVIARCRITNYCNKSCAFYRKRQGVCSLTASPRRQKAWVGKTTLRTVKIPFEVLKYPDNWFIGAEPPSTTESIYRTTCRVQLTCRMLPELYDELSTFSDKGLALDYMMLKLGDIQPPTPRANKPTINRRVSFLPYQIEYLKSLGGGRLSKGVEAVITQYRDLRDI